MSDITVNVQVYIPYTGNIWWEKILANRIGKSYWRGKIWRISYSQCICQIHFQCICEYWQGKLWRIADNSPNSSISFPHQIFPVYGIVIPIPMVTSLLTIQCTDNSGHINSCGFPHHQTAGRLEVTDTTTTAISGLLQHDQVCQSLIPTVFTAVVVLTVTVTCGGVSWLSHHAMP